VGKRGVDCGVAAGEVEFSQTTEFLGAGERLVGIDPEFRPSGQCLDADDLHGGEVDDWLERRLQVLGVEYVVEAFTERTQEDVTFDVGGRSAPIDLRLTSGRDRFALRGLNFTSVFERTTPSIPASLAVVATEAERVTSGVDENTDVLLRLRLGQPCAERQRVLHRGF
jgi:hypothetical protein